MYILFSYCDFNLLDGFADQLYKRVSVSKTSCSVTTDKWGTLFSAAAVAGHLSQVDTTILFSLSRHLVNALFGTLALKQSLLKQKK